MPRFDRDFYWPSRKEELVRYLKSVYPDCDWKKMPKNQLYAIYARFRKQEASGVNG